MKTPMQRLREAMKAIDMPALLLTDLTNIAWLSDFSGSSARVVVTASDARFLTDSRYTIQAAEEVKTIPVTTFAAPLEYDDLTLDVLRELGVTAMGFESASVPYAIWRRWSDKLGADLVPAGDLVSALRLVKSDDEIARTREACGVADAALAHVQRLIQPGVTELDLALELEFFIRRQGAEVAFPSIVVSGERSARPHGRPSEKRLEPGDFVTLDFGAQVRGFNSDITRTFVVSAATDRHREIYDAVLRAQLGALAAMRPGAIAKEVDRVAREILAEANLAQYFGHGLGHSLGRLVHDGGRLGPSSTTVLEVGQIWTVEPGAYVPGFGGARIEDDVVVTENGIEILTHSDKAFTVLPAA